MNKLLNKLSENARFTEEELAAMLGMTAEEVKAQISAFEDKGIVRGYKAIIDWENLDNQRVTALIEIRVTPTMGAGFEGVARQIMRMEEVESVYLMSGGYDLSVTLSGRTFQEVAMFVAKRLAPIDGVVSTATHFVLRRYKEMGVDICDEPADDRGPVSL
ncbi:MAG TPA: AsnC family transcriptional regulator [Ruminococcaceae bacterium]|nr:AsnC family transcriptional regulator [Oscillospiraceae bacterium]